MCGQSTTPVTRNASSLPSPFKNTEVTGAEITSTELRLSSALAVTFPSSVESPVKSMAPQRRDEEERKTGESEGESEESNKEAEGGEEASPDQDKPTADVKVTR